MIGQTVVIIGDTHLKSTDRRAQDRLDAWDWAIDNGIALRPSLWVHAGDVFDELSTTEDRNHAAERLVRMADEAPVIVDYGNHDAEHDLDIFRRLTATHPIIVVGAAEVVTTQCADGNPIGVFCLPYPHKAMLVGAGVPHDQIAAEADKALDVLFVQAGNQLLRLRRDGVPCLMVGHATVSGSVSSVGQPMIGKEIAVSALHLKRLGDVPKVFGHIHKPQEIHGAYHVGSLCRLSYGETEAKRLLVLRFRGAECTAVESIEVPTPARYHVEARIDREALTWAVTRGPDGPTEEPPGTWAGADVRVRVRYPEPERHALPDIRRRAAAPFVGARHVDVEPIAESQRELRAPEVVAATTLDDKLAAWARLSGVMWSDAIAERARELLADNGTLVEKVTARVRAIAEGNHGEGATDLPALPGSGIAERDSDGRAHAGLPFEL